MNDSYPSMLTFLTNKLNLVKEMKDGTIVPKKIIMNNSTTIVPTIKKKNNE